MKKIEDANIYDDRNNQKLCGALYTNENFKTIEVTDNVKVRIKSKA